MVWFLNDGELVSETQRISVSGMSTCSTHKLRSGISFKMFVIFWNCINLAFVNVSSMKLGPEDSRKMELTKKLVTLMWFTWMQVKGFTYFLRLPIKLYMWPHNFFLGKGIEQGWQIFSVKIEIVVFWTSWARWSLLQTICPCPYSVKVAIDNT